MKTKLFVTGVSIDSTENMYYDTYYSYYSNKCKEITISMKVIPFDLNTENEESLNKLFSCINCGKLITLSDFEGYVEPYKEEFKQFLLERYPDKILSNPKDFNYLFGDEKK